MTPAAIATLSVAALVLLPTLRAQSPAGAALAGSVTLVGDYRFRGLSQTYRQPAIQGGVEYAAARGGAYLGTWGSNVSGNQFLNGGSLELDLYGGYRWTAGNHGVDLGAQYYWYPRARYNISPGDRYNTVELYLGAHYAQFTAKYSHAMTNLFGMKSSTVGGFCGIESNGTADTTNCLGTGNSKGSGYADLGATFDLLSGTQLVLHYGHQFVRNYSQLSYGDYKAGLTRQVGGVVLGAAAVGTDAQSRFYRYTPTTGGSQETQNVAHLGFVLSASKAF